LPYGGYGGYGGIYGGYGGYGGDGGYGYFGYNHLRLSGNLNREYVGHSTYTGPDLNFNPTQSQVDDFMPAVRSWMEMLMRNKPEVIAKFM